MSSRYIKLNEIKGNLSKKNKYRNVLRPLQSISSRNYGNNPLILKHDESLGTYITNNRIRTFNDLKTRNVSKNLSQKGFLAVRFKVSPQQHQYSESYGHRFHSYQRSYYANGGPFEPKSGELDTTPTRSPFYEYGMWAAGIFLAVYIIKKVRDVRYDARHKYDDTKDVAKKISGGGSFVKEGDQFAGTDSRDIIHKSSDTKRSDTKDVSSHLYEDSSQKAEDLKRNKIDKVKDRSPHLAEDTRHKVENLERHKREGGEYRDEPKESGERTWDRAAHFGEELKDKAMHMGREATDKVKHAGEEVKDKTVGLGEDIKDSVGRVGEGFKERVPSLDRDMRKDRSYLRDEVGHIRDKAGEYKEDAKDRARHFKDDVKGVGDDVRGRASRLGEDAKDSSRRIGREVEGSVRFMGDELRDQRKDRDSQRGFTDRDSRLGYTDRESRTGFTDRARHAKDDFKETAINVKDDIKDSAIGMKDEIKEGASQVRDDVKEGARYIKDDFRGHRIKDQGRMEEGRRYRDDRYRDDRYRDDIYRERDYPTTERLKDKSRRVGDDVADTSRRIGHEIKDEAEHARDSVSHLGEAVKEKAIAIKDTAVDLGEDIKDKAVDMGEGLKEKVWGTQHHDERERRYAGGGSRRYNEGAGRYNEGAGRYNEGAGRFVDRERHTDNLRKRVNEDEEAFSSRHDASMLDPLRIGESTSRVDPTKKRTDAGREQAYRQERVK